MTKSHRFRTAFIRASTFFLPTRDVSAIRVLASPERTTGQRRAAAIVLCGFTGLLVVLVVGAIKLVTEIILPSWVNRVGFVAGGTSLAVAFAGVFLFWMASPEFQPGYASNSMPEPISIEGPVELIDGKLTLRVPLEAGGDQLAPLARGIGKIDGEFLDVVIQPWLAEKLRIEAGSLVFVDNKNGKFTITRSAANDEPR
jgi:hypothetical protein